MFSFSVWEGWTLTCQQTLYRELKQPRRRRRERQLDKSNRFRLATQQIKACITLFCTGRFGKQGQGKIGRAWSGKGGCTFSISRPRAFSLSRNREQALLNHDVKLPNFSFCGRRERWVNMWRVRLYGLWNFPGEAARIDYSSFLVTS